MHTCVLYHYENSFWLQQIPAGWKKSIRTRGEAPEKIKEDSPPIHLHFHRPTQLIPNNGSAAG